MFVQEQQKYWVEAKPENVAYIASSVNRPVVVLTGKPPQPAQAYVGIVHSPRGYEIYVYLHCIHSNEGLLFRWDQGAVSKDNAPVVQKEAIGFAESMGFMMSDLRWREQNASGRADMFNSVPMFFQDLSRFKEQVEEEVLEIEPAEEELLVEPVEEAPETVTEGDFVIHEEAFAEPGKGRPEEPVPPLGELPDLAPASVSQPQAEVSEEDILLENLEMKEEPEPVSAPAQAQADAPVAAESHPAEPGKGLIIEIDEQPLEEMPEPVQAEEMKITVEEQAPSGFEPTVEEIAVGVDTEPAPGEPSAGEAVEEVVQEEEIVIGASGAASAQAVSEPVPEPAPQPAAERPRPEPAAEILLESEEVQIPILEEPAAKSVPETAAATSSAVVQSEAVPAAAPVQSPIIEQEAIQEQSVVRSAEAEGEPGQDDLALAVRLLAMF